MKWAAEFCQFEKIKRFVPYQHKWSNIYIWLCRGKDALFTYILFVETGCISKLLQGRQDDSTNHENMPVVAVAFNVPVSCVCIYIYIYIAVGMS